MARQSPCPVRRQTHTCALGFHFNASPQHNAHPAYTRLHACRYVRRLQRRYTPTAQLDPDPPAAGPDGDPTRLVPITFVSLLRKGTPDRDRSEAKLASAFDFVSAGKGGEGGREGGGVGGRLGGRLGWEGVVREQGLRERGHGREGRRALGAVALGRGGGCCDCRRRVTVRLRYAGTAWGPGRCGMVQNTPSPSPDWSAATTCQYVPVIKHAWIPPPPCELIMHVTPCAQVVAALRKEHGLPLTYIALDWHEMDKQLGHVGIVEAFWNTVRVSERVFQKGHAAHPSLRRVPPLINHDCNPLPHTYTSPAQVKDLLPAQGFALGTLEKVGPDHTEVCADAGECGGRRGRQGLRCSGMRGGDGGPNGTVGQRLSGATPEEGGCGNAGWCAGGHAEVRAECACGNELRCEAPGAETG